MTPTLDIDAFAIAVRLGAALLAGALLGLDRELTGKSAGMRTHALVSLGAAAVTLAMAASSYNDDDAVSRAIQGVITGIGFLGAGVIMKYEAENRIEGLTTAASIWVAAALGIACGLGLLEFAAIGLGLAVFMLIGGNWIERVLKRHFAPHEMDPGERRKEEARKRRRGD